MFPVKPLDKAVDVLLDRAGHGIRQGQGYRLVEGRLYQQLRARVVDQLVDLFERHEGVHCEPSLEGVVLRQTLLDLFGFAEVVSQAGAELVQQQAPLGLHLLLALGLF
jgi:hypothetical protein